MSVQDALKAHNSRVTNPRMTFHRPFYYRARSLTFSIFQIVWNLALIALILGTLFLVATEVVTLVGGK